MKKLKILMVDDSLVWIHVHKKALKACEDVFELVIDVETSAKAGVEQGKCSNYDLVISDMEMEDVGDKFAGEWLINHLKQLENCQNTKFLVISGAPEIQQIAARLNCDFIPKNIYFNNLQLLRYKLLEMFQK